MSFLKKLKDEFKDLMGDDKDKAKKDQSHSQTQPSQGYPSQPQHSDPHAYNQHQPGYQGQPPQQQQHYQQPPSNYGGPPPGPHLPPGWVQQWDAQSQRYYYIDPATGRSQWDPPSQQHQGYGGHAPPQGYGAPAPGHDTRDASHFYNSSQPQAHYGTTMPHGEEKKKKSGKGGLIAAGVGGAAVGALGVAALSGDSSDEEHHGHAAYGPPGGGYYSSAPMGAGAGVPLEHNPNLSSSQRSSLEEAREDLQEAEAKVRSGSASSSDIEELQEAREEYASEVESAHSELED